MHESSQPTAAVLAAVRNAMASLGFEWYVFGAVAVMGWSRPRTTADVDVTAKILAGMVDTLCQALAAEGLALRVKDRDGFLSRTRVSLSFTPPRADPSTWSSPAPASKSCSSPAPS